MAQSKRNKEHKPEVVVFAGPNGSGKSSYTSDEWIVGQYVNADDIARENRITNQEAADIADAMRDEFLSEMKDFTFETVLSTNRKIDFLQKAKDAGYFIRGYFILTTDPEINISRVNIRVRAGGHGVDRGKIVSRYYKSLGNVPRFIDICDICHIYDNTDGAFRIVRKHKEDLDFYENEYWDEERIVRLVYGSDI